MAVGVVGLLMSLVWMMTTGRRRSVDEGTYVERVDRPSMS
jgi:hypothetical protein